LTATVNLSVIYDRPLDMVGPGKGYLGKDSIVEPVSILWALPITWRTWALFHQVAYVVWQNLFASMDGKWSFAFTPKT